MATVVLGVGAICVLGAYALSRGGGGGGRSLAGLTDHLATWAPGAPDLAVIRDDELHLIESLQPCAEPGGSVHRA